MKRFAATIAALVGALVLAACALGPVTPTGAVGGAYDSLRTFNRLVVQTVDRGRISAAQAERMLAESRKVRQAVDSADDALALCGGKLPCDSFDTIMARLQPMLLELERRLREEEAKKGATP